MGTTRAIDEEALYKAVISAYCSRRHFQRLSGNTLTHSRRLQTPGLWHDVYLYCK